MHFMSSFLVLLVEIPVEVFVSVGGEVGRQESSTILTDVAAP